MTDKELRKLRRSDLIEMLYYMRQEIEDLEAENKQLRERLDALVARALGGSADKDPAQGPASSVPEA